jgi:SAM-dependent methyltransferase
MTTRKISNNRKQFSFAENRPVLLPFAAMTLHPVSNIPLLRGPVPLSHFIMRNVVSEGDKAVDATCGNGHDTSLLAALVGSSGQVWGFDIQELAIAETRRMLSEARLVGQVTLLQTGHEEMGRHVNGPVKAIIFNLGYLPGGDRSVITRPDTTLIAMGQSLKLLAHGGILMVTVYPGHGGGATEQQVVDNWATALEQREFYSWRMGQINVSPDAPYALLIQKAI